MRSGRLQPIATHQMAARRSLSEAGDGRQGRSDLAYMQHKYSALDSRIIIITAAILLLLIAILFLNFFIRWLLRRVFLLRSPKPTNFNKGLSKRQVEALPSFIYSSSKPLSTYIPSPPCGHPIFYPSFISHHLPSQLCHVLIPTSMASTKVGDTDYQHPTKFEGCKGEHNTRSQLVAIQVHKGITDQPSKLDGPLEGNQSPSTHDKVIKDQPSNLDGSLEGNQLLSTHVNVTEDEGLTTVGAHKVNQAVGTGLTSTSQEEGVKNASCNDAIGLHAYKEAKNNVMISSKDDKMDGLGYDNATLASPCPICLVEFADGETIRVLPTCRHYFHIGCIDLWLAKSSSCPACRSNLLDAKKAPTRESTLHVQMATAISQ